MTIPVPCPSNSLTETFDFPEDRFGRSHPGKRPARAVVGLHDLLDAGNQALDAGEAAPADGPLGDGVEPRLHLIGP